MLQVAIASAERGQPRSDGECGRQHEQREQGQKDDLGPDAHAVDNEQADENDHRRREVDRDSEHRCEGEREPRKSHLRQQGGPRDQAVRRLGETRDEDLPRQEPRKDEDRVGNADRLDLDEAAEDEGKCHHEHDRLGKRPEHADGRARVAHLDIAPGEEQDELAVGPEAPEVEAAEAARRRDRHEPLLLVDDTHLVGRSRSVAGCATGERRSWASSA